MNPATLARSVSRLVPVAIAALLTCTAAFATDPVATNDVYHPEGPVYGMPVLSNDSDPDGDPLTIVAVTNGTNGGTVISGQVVFYYPGPWADGNDSFTYTIDDGRGGQATATVTLTNTNPTPADDILDAIAIFYGELNVTWNDSDPEYDLLWVESTTDGTKGTTSVSSNGLIHYVPGPEFDGNDTFTYTVRDMAGGRTSANVTLTNLDPVANDDLYDAAAIIYGSLNVLWNDTDPNGGWLSVESTTDGAHGTTSISPNGDIIYQPGPSFDGNDTFTYSIRDMVGGRATATVTLTNLNPVANDDIYDAAAIIYGSLNVLWNDTDPNGGWFSVESTTNGAHGTTSISPNGDIIYQPGPSFDGNDTFTYSIRDMVGGRATATVTLTNLNPVANDDIYDAAAIIYGSLNVLWNDTDPNGGWFSVESTTNGAHGTTSISPNGDIIYQPGPSFDGNDTFTYSIRDMVGGRATATVTLTNLNPVANDDIYDAVAIIYGSLNVLWNDTDPNGGSFSVESTTNGAHGTTSISPNGDIIYQPGPSFDGNDTFTYSIRDMVGGRATATVTLTNVDPVANDDSYHAAAILSSGLDVLSNDMDPNGGSFSVESTTNGANGTTSISPSGAINYLPGPAFDGNDTFTYTIRDMVGGRATARVTLANAIPIAPDDAATTTEDAGVLIAVLENDTDADPGPLTIQSVTQGANGEVRIEGTRVSYRPVANWSGTDQFTYTLTDNFASASASVVVTVTPVNDPPIATNDSATTAEDNATTIAVLANDSDVDGDSLNIDSVTQAGHGTVTIVGTALRYTPAANWHGSDTFTYKVSDGQGGLTTAAVSLTVTPVNDAPVAANDNATGTEDTVVTIAALSNDSDVDGDTLAIQSVTQGAHGTVAISGTTITYTSETNWNGTDRFTYVISDGHGGSAEATIAITITAVNDAPVFTASSFTKPAATIGVPYVGSIALSATDIDTGDTLSFSKVAGPAWMCVAASGALSGLAPAGSTGDNSFTVRATDAAGLSADATLVITVSGGLSAGWAGSDIGGVGLPGGASETNGTFTVSGSGIGIGGSADGFHFVANALSGNGEIRARITSQSNTNPWAMAGVMIREKSAAESKYAIIAVTPANGYSFGYRATTGGASSSIPGPTLNGVPNNWVRLTRSGSVITAYTSANGAAWTQVGTGLVSMAATLQIGLAVTSADNSALSTATFDNVTVTTFPAPWQNVRIGTPGLEGSAEYFGSAYTLKGAGNLSGNADNVNYVYQALSGDGEIKARVTAPGNTGSNARIGVMVRETLTTGARYLFMGVDGSSGYCLQRRNSTGGATSTDLSGSGTAPNIWIRVVRSGNTLYGYKSVNGATWTLVNSRNISMATNAYIGLVVASGSTATLNTTGFDNVTVVP